MKHDAFQDLMDLARRRQLSAEERARLEEFMEANPQAWPDRDEDMALTRLMNRLPDAPLASNFSARVMQTIALEERQTERAGKRAGSNGWWHGWFARVGFASCVALLATVGWNRHQLGVRTDLAESVATLSEVAAIPSVEALKDFETIQSFGKVPPAAALEADLHLLAALE